MERRKTILKISPFSSAYGRKVLLLAIALLAAAALAPAQGGMAKDEGVDGNGANDYMIRFAHAGSDAEQAQAVADLGGVLVDWMPQINVATVRFPDATAARQATARLMTARQALAVEPDSMIGSDSVAAETVPVDDPDFNNTQRGYGQQRVQLPAAWSHTRGASSIVIAVIDSGIDLAHPEFAGRIAPGYDFVNRDSDPTDDNGHGTHVTGIIAMALDGTGSVGMCPACTIMPLKVLNADNRGNTSNAVRAILHATDQGARVINLSLGTVNNSAIMRDAIAYAHAHGVVVVASVGNYGSNVARYPAAYAEVLAVGATGLDDGVWAQSNYGAWVDVAAPGVTIYSTALDGAQHTYASMSGTSSAAAFVSGLAALVLSQNAALSTTEVQALILENVDDLGAPGRDDYYGYGRLNAYHTLAAAAPAASEAQGKPEGQGRIYLPAIVR